MRFIPTKVHGYLDYSVSLLVMAAPKLLGFAKGGAETWVPVVSGMAGIVYSLYTDYELGVKKRIPMPAHLTLDMSSGALLAASPWLFGFARKVRVPHLVFGLLEIIVPLLSKRSPEKDTSYYYNPALGY